MTLRDILNKAKGLVGMKAISDMNHEEAKAERKRLYANNTGPQRNTRAFLKKRDKLDKRIAETSLHTGFQTQKVW